MTPGYAPASFFISFSVRDDAPLGGGFGAAAGAAAAATAGAPPAEPSASFLRFFAAFLRCDLESFGASALAGLAAAAAPPPLAFLCFAIFFESASTSALS